MANNLNTPWARLTQKEKAELIGIYTKYGYNDLTSIINNYNSYKDGGPLSEEEKTKLINRINSTSKADFVERLKDPNRKTIPYGNGVATHRLAYATDDTGTAIVFPEVQSYEDTLKEFVGRDAIERAIERRDTLNMSIREADWFTKHYKEYYPGFNSYKYGGDKDKFYLVYDALNGNVKPKVSETLTDYFGPHTVSLGFDNNGQADRIYANSGPLFWLFDKGGKIHIKESKRGTFTAAAKSRGMGVQEFASKVLANKDEYSPAMVKKANFARNFAKWHAEGGPLDLLRKALAKNYDADTFSEAFAAARNDDRDYFKWNGNRYNTKLDTEVFRDNNPSNLKEGYAIRDAARRIMQVENSKDSKRGGWDESTQRWYPHRSPEGGADTIAYGIKLSNGTPEAALAKQQGYLTDEQALDALDTLVQKYHDNAKIVYDKKFG